MAAAPKKPGAERGAIRQQVLMQKQQEALTAYIAGLRQKAKIKIDERYASL